MKYVMRKTELKDGPWAIKIGRFEWMVKDC